MADASMFRYVYPSPVTIRERCVSLMTGDLPDGYHSLCLPDEFAEFFALPLTSVRDLGQALEAQAGELAEAPAGAVGVALVAPVMGRSWATDLAHWTIEDLPETCRSEFRASPRLSYWSPVPQMVDGCEVLHGEFMDDMVAFVLGPCADSAVERAGALGGELRGGLRPRGFGFQKDTYSPEKVSLGHEVAPMSYSGRANRRAFW